MPESIRVIIQTRPLLPLESASNSHSVLTLSPPSITVQTRHAHTFTYDAVYPPSPIPHLYHTHAAPLIASLTSGFNATIFAYGQTAAGKSFTMSQITSLAAAQIFRDLPPAAAVRVGFVEIYKEHIRDLVDGAAAPLGNVSVSVRERAVRGRKEVFLDGARERNVATVEELMDIIKEGALLRCTAATKMNACSSRSHSVITVTVLQEDAEKVGKLHLVDLAGSERAKKTGSKGGRFREGVDINRGLLALAKVISSLSSKQPHVPYRDSKLTRLLQDSLGGNARTLLIACVSPASSCAEETLGTLRYAERANRIVNKPTVNTRMQSVEVTDLRANLARSRAEIAALVGENERLRCGRRMSISPGKNDALIVTRDDVIGLRFRVKQLERLLKQARSDTKVGLGCLNAADEHAVPSANARQTPRRMRPKRLHVQFEQASEQEIGPVNHASPPKVPGNEESKTSGSETMSSESDSESVESDMEAVLDVRSATRMAEMRRTFTARLRQTELDKKAIEEERVKLLKRMQVMEKRHDKELEVLKGSHTTKLAEMRYKLSTVHKLEAESTRLTKLRDGSDAVRKKLHLRVKTAEQARDEVVAQLSSAILQTETVKKNLGKENRELFKHERLLRSQVSKMQVSKRKLDAVVARLRVENEAMRGKLRDVGRHNVRRANSGFAARVGTGTRVHS